MVDIEEDKVRYIVLSAGQYALIDDSDYERIGRHNWSASPRYSKTTGDLLDYYAVRVVDEQMILMHRVVLDYWGDMDIDHINHNGLDNRKSNLRLLTRTQNNLNRSPDLWRGIKVRILSDGSLVYDARVGWNGLSVHLGTFRSHAFALMFRDRAAKDIVSGKEYVRGYKRVGGRWSRPIRLRIYSDNTYEVVTFDQLENKDA